MYKVFRRGDALLPQRFWFTEIVKDTEVVKIERLKKEGYFESTKYSQEEIVVFLNRLQKNA